MAVAIVKTQQFSWAGNYPLNFSGTVTDIGAGSTLALLFFSAGPSYDVASLRPNVTLGGVAATYVGAFSNAAAGTTWVYAVKNPTNGSVTATISNAYVGDGRMTIVSLSGTDETAPIGAVAFAGINATGATTTTTLTTTAANSLVITHGNGIYGGTPSNTGGSPAVTQFLADDSVSNRILRGWSQAPGASGTAVTGSWNNTYNQAVFSVIEVKAGGGAPAQSVTPSGRASTAALGSPTVTASLNKQVAPTGIASTNAFGTAVARYPQTVSMSGLKSGGMGSPSVAAVSEQSPWNLSGAGSVFTVARTGAATYFDASRVLQAVAASGARQMHDDGFSLGVMAEEASTNLITDNTASAAVVSGAYPTGGGWYNGGVAGLTCVVAGKGVEDGIEYVDLRFQGSNPGVEAYPSYNMSGMLNAPVANGDVLTLSAYCRVVAGTGVRASDGYPLASLGINVHDSTQGYLASLTNFQPLLQTDKLEREWTTATVANASAAYANALIALTVPAATTIDFTLRLGLPQLEKKTRPTSVIKTAGSAAVARGAETLTALLPSGTDQTIYVERVGYTGLQKIDTYTTQTIASGQWVVPADVDFPYVRRVSRSVLTNQRAQAVVTARNKGWRFGSAFKLTDYNASTAYANLLKAEADIYCPEYEFKMDQVQPTTEGTFTWTVADNFAARAVADGKLLRGHALIWHIATPTWANTVLNGSPTTARWQGMINSMAQNVMPRWACTTWDVVNEVIEPTDGLANGFRNSPWYKAAGTAFVAYAFQRAAAYNTHGAELCIAEYGMEENDAMAQSRRTHFLNLLTTLVNDGVPIDGVCLQAHLDIERPFSKSAFTAFLNSIKALGLNIHLTEIDVRAPAQDTTLQYDLRAARRIRQVLDCFQAVTTGREIVFWNLNDSYSWLTVEFPSRTQRPLPFDTTNTPKALYAALQQAFELNKSAAAPQSITMAGRGTTAAFGSHAVSIATSGQSVSVPGRASTAAIGSAKVSHGLKATGLASTSALGSAKINQTIRATGRASSGVFGTHKTVFATKPAGIAPTSVLGSAKVSHRIFATGKASSAALGTAKVSHHLTASGKASSVAFGVAKLSHRLTMSGKATSVAFGVQKIVQKANVGGIASTSSLGVHKLVHRLVMQGKASGALLGTLSVKTTTSLVIPSISPSVNLGVFVVSKGGVALLPPGIAGTSALGAPTVASGRVTVSHSGIAATARFGSHTLKLVVRASGLAVGSALGTQTVKGKYTLGPSGVSSVSALGQPNVLRGAVQVTHNGLPTSVSLGNPQVTTGARMVSTPGIASSAQVGSPTIVPGKVTVSPSGRASSVALGTASVARGKVTVSVSGKASSLSFGTAKLSHRLAVGGLASGARFGTGKIVSRITVSGVTKTSGLGTPKASIVIKATGKASSASLGAAMLSTGKVTVSPAGIKSGAVGTPLILAGTLIMVPVSIPPGSRFGTPEVLRGAVSVSVQGIASTSGVGSPRASAGGATIAPAGLASNARFGTHVLTSRVSLVVPGVAPTSAPGAPAVSTVSRVFSTGIASSTALGSLKVSYKTYVMSILGRRAFGTAQVLPGVRTVAATGIASTTQMGGASVIKGAAGIRPSGIATRAALGIAALSTGPVTVRPGSIPTGARFGSGTVKHRIAAMGIDSTAAFGQLRIEVGPISLGAQGISPRSAVGAPSVLRGRVTAQAQGIASTSGLGEPTVIRQTIIAVPGLASGARFGVTILRTSAVQVSPLSITSLGAMGLPYVFVGERPIGKPAMIFRVQGSQWKLKVPGTNTFKFKVPRRAK